jgi:hypothetical protein
MLLVVIASCRHVASCSPIASCRLSRRVASSRRVVLTHRVVPSLASRRVVSLHASLGRSCRRRCVASSPPRLTCLVVAVSCVITSLSCRHRPSPHCFWLVVVFVPSPARRRSLLRCVASSPLTHGTIAALPHLSRCCVASCSPVASLPSLRLPPASLRAVVVASRRPRLASPVLLCRRSCVRTRSISIAMTHRRRDEKSIRRRVGTPGSYRHQSLPPAPARWRKRDDDASTPTTCRDGDSLNTAFCD